MLFNPPIFPMRAADEGTHFSIHISEFDLQAFELPGPSLRLRFSKTDGRVSEVDPEQPAERIKGELARLIVEARQWGANNLGSARHLLLSRLMLFYLDLCWKNPGSIVLIHLTDNYEALMQHATTVSNALKLPLSRRLNSPMCAIPAFSVNETAARLRELGHQVVLAEYEPNSR